MRLLGVGVAQLEPADQLDLFAAGTPTPAGRLDAALDRIRERFGDTAVKRGSALE